MTHLDTVLFWIVGVFDAVLFGTWAYEWVLSDNRKNNSHRGG